VQLGVAADLEAARRPLALGVLIAGHEFERSELSIGVRIVVLSGARIAHAGEAARRTGPARVIEQLGVDVARPQHAVAAGARRLVQLRERETELVRYTALPSGRVSHSAEVRGARARIASRSISKSCVPKL